ncbi:MAG: hypothetical protein ACJAXE_000840 [Neolewinella sp.]|jgi:hypothetical protein
MTIATFYISETIGTTKTVSTALNYITRVNSVHPIPNVRQP